MTGDKFTCEEGDLEIVPTLAALAALAEAARPIDDDDYGSDRQVEAENALFDIIERIVPASIFEEFQNFCLKATTAERIEFGHNLGRFYLTAEMPT